MINIVIPMAGLGSRFSSAGFDKPKPFIDVLGKPMIVNVLDNLKCKNARYILIARKEHIDQESELCKKIMSEYNAVFVPIDQTTEGAACTVLFAREFINNDTSLIIANSDQIIDGTFQHFVDDCRERGLDGSIMTFKDPHKDTKWSFARVDGRGYVLEVKEKQAISDMATVGIYLFSKGRDFVNASLDMIVRNDRVKNEFYVCPVYNHAIRTGSKIGVYDIPFVAMHGIGTPEDLAAYIKTKKG